MADDTIDLGLELLDRQLVDREGTPVGKVDDLELDVPDDGSAPRVAALLVGGVAFGGRIGGRLGRWIRAASATLAGTDAPFRVPLDEVEELGTTITLAWLVHEDHRPVAPDRWLRDHLIRWIPGATREGE